MRTGSSVNPDSWILHFWMVIAIGHHFATDVGRSAISLHSDGSGELLDSSHNQEGVADGSHSSLAFLISDSEWFVIVL